MYEVLGRDDDAPHIIADNSGEAYTEFTEYAERAARMAENITSFDSNERSSDSPLIEQVWWGWSSAAEEFTSTAVSHSEIVIARWQGNVTVTVRGPETKATAAAIPAEAEYIGIVFKLGAFMPLLLPKTLKDRRDVFLRIASKKSFWLDSAVREIPTYENADTFAERLVREDLLVHDPVVSAALRGQQPDVSPRTLQYRFMRATGLSQKTIQQIERANQAVALLQQGTSISDTAYEVGYFDQAHMTNALKRFLGQTPAQLSLLNAFP